MRILVIAPQPFFIERGTPIAVRQLVETLCAGGHQVDLLTFHLGADITVAGLRMLRIPRLPFIRSVPPGFSLRKLVCDLVLSVWLLPILLINRYHVVHAVEEAVFPALLFSLAARRRRLVYDMDSSLADQVVEKWPLIAGLRGVLRWFECRAVRAADLVLAVCPRLADRARECHAGKRIRVLEDIPMVETVAPVDEQLRAQLPPDTLLALYVGNLEHYQGVDLLLDSLVGLPDDLAMRVVFIGGEPPQVQRYREIARQKGVAGRCAFLGVRPLAGLGGYLAQADILISPRNKGVNTPMKIYSYLASGRPILATGIESHTQVLDQETAMLVEPTPSALAAGLEKLARDPGLRQRLGSSGAALAQREYSPAAYRNKLHAAYRELESGRQGDG